MHLVRKEQLLEFVRDVNRSLRDVQVSDDECKLQVRGGRVVLLLAS